MKPHDPSPEDWCVPQNMEGLEYLLVEPACEVNEKGTREKNDGNEDLSLDDNEKIEADSGAESFAEEDWKDPEQDEVPKWTGPAGTRSGNRKRTGMRYNRYGDDFLINKIWPDELGDELLSVGELEADDEWQIINDSEHYPKEDNSTPEQETDLAQSEIERRENTNLRILEWMRNVKSKGDEGKSIQHVEVSAEQHVRTEDPLFGWTATDRALEKPSDNLDPASSTGTSINFFCPGSGGRTYPHRKFDDKETQGSKRDQRARTGRGRGRAYHRTKFEIPNEYSENILITDSDFILSDRTSAILLRDYFEEAMRKSSSALPLMANLFVRTAGQLMFAWGLVGVELEVLTSRDKLKLGNKSLEVYQMLVQHVARGNSGLSLARRKDATCFLRWIMSVMTNSTVQACHQKAMGSKTMERRVSTVILNVYQSTGTEKEDDSRQSLENHWKLDEIRRFHNKKFEEGHDVHRNLALAEDYSRPNTCLE